MPLSFQLLPIKGAFTGSVSMEYGGKACWGLCAGLKAKMSSTQQGQAVKTDLEVVFTAIFEFKYKASKTESTLDLDIYEYHDFGF